MEGGREGSYIKSSEEGRVGARVVPARFGIGGVTPREGGGLGG